VQHQYRIRFGGTVFHPGDPHSSAVAVGGLAILCGIRKFRQMGKAFAGRAQTLHDPNIPNGPIAMPPFTPTAANKQRAHKANFSANCMSAHRRRTILAEMIRRS
jgi:hypothetical protein